MADLVKLKKGNRIIHVDENVAGSYLARGYDQVGEDGKVKKLATGGKNVSTAEYNNLVKELEDLKENGGNGGVSQKEYDKVVAERDDAAEKAQDLNTELGELKESYNELEEKAKEYAEKGKALQEENKKLKQNNK